MNDTRNKNGSLPDAQGLNSVPTDVYKSHHWKKKKNIGKNKERKEEIQKEREVGERRRGRDEGGGRKEEKGMGKEGKTQSDTI